METDHSHTIINASDHAHIHQGDIIYGGEKQSPIDRLMSSLVFPEILQRYEQIQARHGKTFDWVLDPPKDSDNGQGHLWDSFIVWMQNDEPIYWISGKPASGKSTLVKFLHDSLCLRNASIENSTLIFSVWLWEAGVPLQKSAVGFLRSLLWQITKHPLLRPIVDNVLFEHAITIDQFIWTEARLQQILRKVFAAANSLEKRMLLFLDGLDESGSDVDILLDLAKDFSLNYPFLKVVISSRPEPDIRSALMIYPSLKLQDLNRQDIKDFIQEKFLGDPSVIRLGEQDESSLNKLTYELLDKAQGVFLWVKLAVRNLLRGISNLDSFNTLKQRLDSLPDDLDSLFTHILTRRDAERKFYEPETALYFRLILHGGAMPLVQFALAINDSTRASFLSPSFQWDLENFESRINLEAVKVWVDVRSLGLLEVIRDRFESLRGIPRAATGSVGFVHRTAQSYLLDTVNGQKLTDLPTLTRQAICDICFESALVGDTIFEALFRMKADIVRPVRYTFEIYGYSRCPNCFNPSQASVDGLKSVLDELVRRKLLGLSRSWHPNSAFSIHKLYTSDGSNVDYCFLYCHLRWWQHALQVLPRSAHQNSEYLSSLLLFVAQNSGGDDPELSAADRDSQQVSASTVFNTLLRQGADPLSSCETWYGETITLLPDFVTIEEPLLEVEHRITQTVQATCVRSVPSIHGFIRAVGPRWSLLYSCLFGDYDTRDVWKKLCEQDQNLQKSSAGSEEVDSFTSFDPSVTERNRVLIAWECSSDCLYAVSKADSQKIIARIFQGSLYGIHFDSGMVMFNDKRRSHSELSSEVKEVLKRSRRIHTIGGALLHLGKKPEHIHRYLEWQAEEMRVDGESEEKILEWKAKILCSDCQSSDLD